MSRTQHGGSSECAGEVNKKETLSQLSQSMAIAVSTLKWSKAILCEVLCLSFWDRVGIVEGKKEERDRQK
jgi:hypothetical protein